MEEMLMKYGYKNIEPNTWTKCDWTVRFDKDLIEIFNDPDKAPGKYYTYPTDKINLKDYLEEIDTYLLKEALVEPGIINQINNVPVYSYEKLSMEMIEQVTKSITEFNELVNDALKEMINEIENGKKTNKRR